MANFNRYPAGASRFPIFAFWEPKEKLPPYLQLCMNTWQNAKAADVIFLDYASVSRYAKLDFDMEKLKRFPIAQQADVLRLAMLNQTPGLWMDCDTLVFREPTEVYDCLESRDVVLIGNPNAPRAALSFLATGTANSGFMSEALAEMAELIETTKEPAKAKWNFLGQPFYRRVRETQHEGSTVTILSSAKYGYYHEAVFGSGRGKVGYRDYWFSRGPVPAAIAEHQGSSMAVLHNSWTPRSYRQKSRIKAMSSRSRLSQYFVQLLAPVGVRKMSAMARSLRRSG